jgi:hypothetical protein
VLGHEDLLDHNRLAPGAFQPNSVPIVAARAESAVTGARPDGRIDVEERKWAVSGQAGGAPREVEFAELSSDVR